MSFKYKVGQSVMFAPQGDRKGVYTVVRQMPEQPGVEEPTYRIKREAEGFERNVRESELSKSG